MKLGYNLELKQTQKLIMTQELQQAIQLLQYNNVELNQYIKNEIQENPMLELEGNLLELEHIEETPLEEEIDWKEFIEKYDDISYKSQADNNQEEYNYENFTTYTESLEGYLISQLNLLNINEKEYIIGDFIIHSIDRNGYLKTSVEEIADLLDTDIEEVSSVLGKVQKFEPAGVASRDLKECLLLQIKRQETINPIAIKIIENNLEDLARNQIARISEEISVDISEAQEVYDYIKTLEPKPGKSFYDNNIGNVDYIVPDASIELIDDEFVIVINDVTGPRLNISNYYKNLIKKNSDAKTVEFLTEKLNSAMWLIKSIDQRRQTIYKVIESILKFQLDFFKTGTAGLVPLTLKDVADDIDMHQSTISRTTNGKYVQTPRGIYELKYFFTRGLVTSDGQQSSRGIKSTIKTIIENENQKKPYSDQKITDILKERGTDISRRTVAKYRNELDIPSSNMRKRFA